jgi:hypothetical protein
MRRSLTVLASVVALACLAGAPLWAQRGGGHGGGMGGGTGGGMGASAGRGASESAGPGMDRGRGMSSMPMSTSGRNAPVERLSDNTHLSSKLQSLLPAGTNLQDAAAGFKNLGQFGAAVHVSHNLGIPFDQLKAKMTGPNSVSLGKAIHELNPDVNAKAEVKKAGKQADRDFRESENQS